MIEGAAGEVHNRHQRRAIHRRPHAANDAPVSDEQSDDGNHRGRAETPGDTEHAEQHAGENGDVAAGDCDDVIGSRFLQPTNHLVVQSGAVPDDDGGHN
jgi:hypothetical protein